MVPTSPETLETINNQVVTWSESDGDVVVIDVWVVPGASRSVIDGPLGDALKVRVTAPPERGKANRAVIELLESRLATPVELVSGGGSRRKRLRVAGLSLDEVRKRLS